MRFDVAKNRSHRMPEFFFLIISKITFLPKDLCIVYEKII